MMKRITRSNGVPSSKGQNQLGDYIRHRRDVLDMSLRELEAATGIERGSLSRIENGSRQPSPELLQRIAEALRIDYEDLYAVSGISRPEKLPEMDAYLRTRYRGELTATDRKSLERYFDELRAKRGDKRGK
jgi:transcriptional regulator with XRE-family HTH domain